MMILTCPLCQRACEQRDQDDSSKWICYCGDTATYDYKYCCYRRTGNKIHLFFIYDFEGSGLNFVAAPNSWEIYINTKSNDDDSIAEGTINVTPEEAVIILKRYKGLRAFI